MSAPLFPAPSRMMVTFRCSCDPRLMKMLEVCMGTELAVEGYRSQPQAQITRFVKLVRSSRLQDLSGQDGSTWRQHTPMDHDGFVQHRVEGIAGARTGARRDNRR